ncbi:MAG: lysostaphin resistance A-like protein [Bryobacteraceae bacterium]
MTIPAKANGRLKSLPLIVHVLVYAAIGWLGVEIFGHILPWIGGYYWGSFAASFATAVFANWFTLRIYTNRRLVELGLWWNRASAENLALGLIGGAGAAALVLAPPLIAGAAHVGPIAGAEQLSFGGVVFLTTGLIVAAAGEELMMRGYGFQVLLASCGTWATIIPVGIVFALLHSGNPNATWFSVANTAGFGILFGYAFVRTRDLWLPIGLHFGWNFTLPLFGVNISGLRMRMTGHEMVWSAGTLWSGGDYGPEASVLTSAVMILLALFIWKAPVHRQPSPLTDPPEASQVCAPSPALPS